MLVATWNVEWAAPARRETITARLASLGADLLVVTEGVASVLPSGGYTALGGSDWGYPVKDPEWRKVLLWSRHRLSDISTETGYGLPPGRIVSATVDSPLGPVRVVAICVPWAQAHVSNGTRAAAPWLEHLKYLDGLRQLLANHPAGVPLVLMGDINQRIPRVGAPSRVSGVLEDVLRPLTVVTAGDIPGLTVRTVDHIVVTSTLRATEVFGISRKDERGIKLSDHDLTAARLTTA